MVLGLARGFMWIMNLEYYFCHEIPWISDLQNLFYRESLGILDPEVLFHRGILEFLGMFFLSCDPAGPEL